MKRPSEELKIFARLDDFSRILLNFQILAKYWSRDSLPLLSRVSQVVSSGLQSFFMVLLIAARPRIVPLIPRGAASRTLKASEIGLQILRNQTLLRLWMIFRRVC